MENIREQKGGNREQVPNPATLDHSVTSYDMQGSYGEAILFTPVGECAERVHVGECAQRIYVGEYAKRVYVGECAMSWSW